MANPPLNILVAGDVFIDWLLIPAPPNNAKAIQPQALQPAVQVEARAGGAILLARLVEAAVAATSLAAHVSTCQLPVPAAQISRDQAVHAILELDRVPVTRDPRDAKSLTYRVKRFMGYSVPPDGCGVPIAISPDDPDAAVVVLYDAGFGFRADSSVWPAALTAAGKQPAIILKMGRFLASGKLWDLLRQKHADRLIVVVDADDLRPVGVNISRRLSWERSAKDLVWQLACNAELTALANCGNLIVRFGLDGAVLYGRRGGRIETHLYYDPSVAEDGLAENCPGEMSGVGSAFIAALAARVAADGVAAVGEGIREGIRASRRLLLQGFGTNTTQLTAASPDLFNAPRPREPHIADVAIPSPIVGEPADPAYWSILRDATAANPEEIAFEIVTLGSAPSLRSVPSARFRNLVTVDRTEIESYRSIRNLMLEYLKTSKPKRPLSIAVFGPPGSGKSFGVTEVAEGLAPGQVKKVEFNIAQFSGPADLIAGLHKVRDVALSGIVPLVFFDEFDSRLDAPLGWLKYFLAPMQDGEFKEGEATHPIGKAIFVFAGGTSNCYAEFGHEGPASGQKAEEADMSRRIFREAKGTDFVSRLRGYVDVLGPNPAGASDRFYMIRRAMLLRSLIERKARHLIDDGRRMHIDSGVLRALIRIPHYKHGVRSMEAILDMSMLAGRNSFEQAALPPLTQINLHVDGELFARLVSRDVLLGASREMIAQQIHERFRMDQSAQSARSAKDGEPLHRPADDPSMRPWEDLPEEMREATRRQADDIPAKLRRIGCGFVPVPPGRADGGIELIPDEVEQMAEMEHARWCAETRLASWTVGKQKDREARITPYLVEWSELPENVREWDRQAVRNIPRLLAEVGFEVYRVASAQPGANTDLV
jgi:hypothetical protein